MAVHITIDTGELIAPWWACWTPLTPAPLGDDVPHESRSFGRGLEDKLGPSDPRGREPVRRRTRPSYSRPCQDYSRPKNVRRLNPRPLIQVSTPISMATTARLSFTE